MMTMNSPFEHLVNSDYSADDLRDDRPLLARLYDPDVPVTTYDGFEMWDPDADGFHRPFLWQKEG